MSGTPTKKVVFKETTEQVKRKAAKDEIEAVHDEIMAWEEALMPRIKGRNLRAQDAGVAARAADRLESLNETLGHRAAYRRWKTKIVSLRNLAEAISAALRPPSAAGGGAPAPAAAREDVPARPAAAAATAAPSAAAPSAPAPASGDEGSQGGGGRTRKRRRRRKKTRRKRKRRRKTRGRRRRRRRKTRRRRRK